MQSRGGTGFVFHNRYCESLSLSCKNVTPVQAIELRLTHTVPRTYLLKTLVSRRTVYTHAGSTSRG